MHGRPRLIEKTNFFLNPLFFILTHWFVFKATVQKVNEFVRVNHVLKQFLQRPVDQRHQLLRFH